MTKPKPASPTLSTSHADLTSALAQIGTEIDQQPLRSSALARIMRETFHGSDAGGAWDWRMFLPHGDGIDTAGILARIVGQASNAAPVAAE